MKSRASGREDVLFEWFKRERRKALPRWQGLDDSGLVDQAIFVLMIRLASDWT
jgi:hypothetical protein